MSSYRCPRSLYHSRVWHHSSTIRRTRSNWNRHICWHLLIQYSWSWFLGRRLYHLSIRPSSNFRRHEISFLYHGKDVDLSRFWFGPHNRNRQQIWVYRDHPNLRAWLWVYIIELLWIPFECFWLTSGPSTKLSLFCQFEHYSETPRRNDCTSNIFWYLSFPFVIFRNQALEWVVTSHHTWARCYHWALVWECLNWTRFEYLDQV